MSEVMERTAVMLREATLDDVPDLLRMVEQFRTQSIYQHYVGPNTAQLAATVEWLITSDLGVIFVALKDDQVIGMLGLVQYLHPLSGVKAANELFWWLDPEHRGWGGWLLRRGEKWAKSQGCEVIQMIAPADKPHVMAMYERVGYGRMEVTFQKELR